MARRAKVLGNQSAAIYSATAITEVPKPPNYFDDERKEIWKNVWESLKETGGNIRQSLYQVETHVVAIMNMRRCERDKNCRASTKAAAVEEVRRTAVDLGLTMATFTRTTPPKVKTEPVKLSPESSSLEERLLKRVG